MTYKPDSISLPLYPGNASARVRLRNACTHICCANTLWLTLFTVGFAVFFIGMPKYFYDIKYFVNFKPWLDSLGVVNPEHGGNFFKGGFPWDCFLYDLEYRYLTDNIRLCNVITAVLMLLPKWVGSGISTLMLLHSVLICFRLAGVDVRRSSLLPFGLAMWTFGMPWVDSFGALDFQWNYIFGGWLALLFYNALVRWKEADFRLMSRRALPAIAFCFLSAVNHEGFALPLLASIATLAMLGKDWRKPGMFLCMGIIAIGVALLMTSPNMHKRMAVEMVDHGFHLSDIAKILARGAYVFVATVPLMLWMMRKPAWRQRVLTPTTIFFLVAAVASLCINIITHAGARMNYLVEMSSIVIFLHLILILAPYVRPRTKVACRHLSAISAAAAIGLLACVGAYSLEFRRAYMDAMDRYTSSDEPTMFGSMNVPDFLLPYSVFDFNAKAAQIINAYFGYDTRPFGSTISIIPEELADVTASSGILPDAGSPVRKVAGYYFMPLYEYEGLPDYNWHHTFNLDMGSGNVQARCVTQPFRSNADGKTYLWILPWIKWPVFNLSKVRSITPLPDTDYSI